MRNTCERLHMELCVVNGTAFVQLRGHAEVGVSVRRWSFSSRKPAHVPDPT
jgi:hypothetical protein